MIDQLIEVVRGNDIMQAALVAAPATAITYGLRNIPFRIYSSLKSWVSYDLTFRSDSEEYYYVNKIVREEIVNEKWSRDFTYDKVSVWNNSSAQNERVYSGLSIGYGRHLGRYNKQPVVVVRSFEESGNSAVFKETLTVTFLGFNRKNVERFCDHITELMTKVRQDNTISLRRNSYSSWVNHGVISPRSMDTVFTNNNIKEELADFIQQFEDEQANYRSKGLPWHTGILLKGPPGTGKTSLIHALASKARRDICFLNLAALEDDRELADLIGGRSRNWAKSFLVIEDIDTAGVAVSREDEGKPVSLSSLLNLLDGFLTPEGMITIGTTNHPERLDPALIRSGRFDKVVELGPLCWDEANKMSILLTNNQIGMRKEDYVPKVGSDLRQILLKRGMSL